MRSSKSRSRSKSNRPRTMGNIVNRVFDSSGPEGKVRGTPQQIIEKYLFLARDAQLSNDRVAAENFLQHAEHYTRMLSEAQRELAAEQEARQSQPQNQPQNGNGQQGQQNRDRQPGREDRGDYRNDQREDRSSGEQPYFRHAAEVIEPTDAVDDNGLVETPESRSRHQPRSEAEAPESAQPEAVRNADKPAPRHDRRPPRPRSQPAEEAAPSASMMPAMPSAPEGEASKAESSPRKPRGPRKPRAEGPGNDTPKDGSSHEAAE